MEINTGIVKNREKELLGLLDEASLDQEKLKGLLMPAAEKIAKISNRKSYVRKLLLEAIGNAGKEIGYEPIGVEQWDDKKVFVLMQEKGNLYKQLGVHKGGCIVRIGELMTITE